MKYHMRDQSAYFLCRLQPTHPKNIFIYIDLINMEYSSNLCKICGNKEMGIQGDTTEVYFEIMSAAMFTEGEMEGGTKLFSNRDRDSESVGRPPGRCLTT